MKLFIEPYPSKKEFEAEANRTDTPSWPMIHVEFYHPKLDAIDYHNDLLSELFYNRARSQKRFLPLLVSDRFGLKAQEVFVYKSKKDVKITSHTHLWVYRDIEFWIGLEKDTLKLEYDYWKAFLKEFVTKTKFQKGDFRNYRKNLYAGLRIEFHD